MIFRVVQTDPLPKLVWLDSGHFVLDENTPQVAQEIKAAFAE